eukprot:3939033-Pleurochrysis_carterae.AAC.1
MPRWEGRWRAVHPPTHARLCLFLPHRTPACFPHTPPSKSPLSSRVPPPDKGLPAASASTSVRLSSFQVDAVTSVAPAPRRRL